MYTLSDDELRSIAQSDKEDAKRACCILAQRLEIFGKEECVRWYDRACKLGDSEAAFHLAEMYRLGTPFLEGSLTKALNYCMWAKDLASQVPLDASENYYKKVASELGNILCDTYYPNESSNCKDDNNTREYVKWQALFCEAHLYMDHLDDAEKALSSLKAAERYKWGSGIDRISQLYFDGKVVPENSFEIQKWLQRAVDVGNEDAVKRLETVEKRIAPSEPPAKQSAKKRGGCYVATAVYGSYDCPEVWTLRRFRDETLAETWYGRAFIRFYYAISPSLVRWFGKTNWFQRLWRGRLDRLVRKLQSEGVADTPYEDKTY